MPPQSTPANANAIVSFFDAYPSFTYNPSAPSAAQEFRRLGQDMGWGKNAQDGKKAWKDFQIAVAKQFNKLYGTDPENLKAWQRLCSTLNIDPAPVTLKDARAAVLEIHANPIDLVEGFKSAREVKTFASEAELAEYIRRYGKLIYPTTPGAGQLLQMLLNPRGRVLQELKRAAAPSEPTPPNPILAFFEMYPTFTYSPAAPSVASEFRRLCTHRGWEKGDPDQKTAWRDFQNALARRFNSLYGVDVESLKLWQRLCSTLKIDPVPESLEEARQAVFGKHFNLVDLIEGYKGARDVRTFESDIELAEYSRREGKIISESSPAAGPLLQALMRNTTYGPLNAPLKAHQLGRNAVNRDRGKARKGGRGGAAVRGAEQEMETGKSKTKETARSTARKQLVTWSGGRSGAFLDGYGSDF